MGYFHMKTWDLSNNSSCSCSSHIFFPLGVFLRQLHSQCESQGRAQEAGCDTISAGLEIPVLFTTCQEWQMNLLDDGCHISATRVLTCMYNTNKWTILLPSTGKIAASLARCLPYILLAVWVENLPKFGTNTVDSCVFITSTEHI